jgi:hypothetical protein
MRFEMCAVDHDAIRFAGASSERRKDTIKYAQSAPAHETVVQGLGWSICSRCIAPTQTVADDKDDSTDHAAIIDAGNTMRQWEERKRDFRYTRWPAGWSVMLASGEPGLSQ